MPFRRSAATPRSTATPLRRSAATLALLGLAACTSPPAISPPPAPDPDSPVASYVRTGPWGEGDTALLEGVLRLEDGCLVVEDAAGTRTVPVFPTDFAWDQDDGALTGRGHALGVDEPVALGGGFTSGSEVIDHLPEGCEAGEHFIVHSVGR